MSVAVAFCRVYGRHSLGAFGQYSFTVYEGFCIQQAFSEICVSSDNRVAVPRTGNGAVLDYIPQDLIIVIVEVFREVIDVLVIHLNLFRHNFPPYLRGNRANRRGWRECNNQFLRGMIEPSLIPSVRGSSRCGESPG